MKDECLAYTQVQHSSSTL